MDFKNEKYEYMLHTWGGFYNKEYVEKHGKESGYFFFDTMGELQEYLKELKTIEKELNAFHLATEIEEGQNVRYKTIAKMKLKYSGKEYDYEYDFGYAYPIESAHFMFKDGNFSCDCNKSIFLHDKYGDEVQEKDCGDEIEITEFKVSQVKPTNTTWK